MVFEMDSLQNRDFEVVIAGGSNLQDQFFRSIRMDFQGLRLEYALQGGLNYVAWKDRMEAVLEDNGLKEFIENDIPKPTTSNAQDLV